MDNPEFGSPSQNVMVDCFCSNAGRWPVFPNSRGMPFCLQVQLINMTKKGTNYVFHQFNDTGSQDLGAEAFLYSTCT